MTFKPCRRSLAASLVAIASVGWPGRPSRAAGSGADAASSPARAAFLALERQSGGRLGVMALDTGASRSIGYRAGERFAMCSTHKFLTAAAILAMVDAGRLTLDHPVAYGRDDLLSYAPVTRKHVDAGRMSVDALTAAAIQWSDNTAANLLLGLIGGPAGWTRYARSIGDAVSRLDRIEPGLNEAAPGDPRDTTTPAAAIGDLDAVLRGAALSEASRARLQGWMVESEITNDLLRAGMPAGWRVGDKSGSGDNGTRNDIGIVLRPGGAPILAAVFLTGSTAPAAARDAVVASAGRIIARSFGG